MINAAAWDKLPKDLQAIVENAAAACNVISEGWCQKTNAEAMDDLVKNQGVIARLAGEGESRGRRGRTLMNFRDVQIGPLDSGLFEMPPGVQVIRVKGADLPALLESMEAAGQIGRRR